MAIEAITMVATAILLVAVATIVVTAVVADNNGGGSRRTAVMVDSLIGSTMMASVERFAFDL